ncbi:hypothetical protein CTI12_AA296500 [Artemisia annua]|uniref:No apical meristem-associated C-terminal domain-containing protein n=1 Tax=Artemisia annua TaxID=35608 RepID=A0A2U1N6X3_ARTAN|nr:hypothetical protein CTI12_AA296500 [Artemisia annua]
MMTGKWTTLQGACNKFAGVVEENERLSGENDSKHLNRCYTIFKELWGYAFTHHEAWEVLNDHSKWRGVKTVKPERRVQGLDDIEEPNELFQDDAIPRPPGKPRPSKNAKSDSTHSAASSSSREAFKEMIQKKLRVEQKKKN